jgi:hypothetical protein
MKSLLSASAMSYCLFMTTSLFSYSYDPYHNDRNHNDYAQITSMNGGQMAAPTKDQVQMGAKYGTQQDPAMNAQPMQKAPLAASCANGQCLAAAPEAQACCPADQALEDCWCLHIHYEPSYYYTQRCCEEQVPCTKTCCRYVPQYYEVERCRYVPQTYCETLCRYEPEYYEVADCKTETSWVCDQHCKYVPCYYWQHTCGDQVTNYPCK